MTDFADLNSGVKDNCFKSMNRENWLVFNNCELGCCLFGKFWAIAQILHIILALFDDIIVVLEIVSQPLDFNAGKLSFTQQLQRFFLTPHRSQSHAAAG